MIAPIMALALATVVPLSKSQSTTKALTTKTTPTKVCHNRTGACSWSWPHEAQPSWSWSCECSGSCRLRSEVTCIQLYYYGFGDDSTAFCGSRLYCILISLDLPSARAGIYHLLWALVRTCAIFSLSNSSVNSWEI